MRLSSFAHTVTFACISALGEKLWSTPKRHDGITMDLKAINDFPFKLDANGEKKISGLSPKATVNQKVLENAIPKSSTSTIKQAFQRNLDENGYADTFDFDASQYSIKYMGCSKLSAYSDDLAVQNEYSILQSKTFVSFRLCPSASCSDSSNRGCASGYGEYLIPVTYYLEAMLQYQAEDYSLYCNYCEQCMYFEKYFYGNRKLGDQHACKYYESCVNYLDVCVSNGEDGSYSYPADYKDFLGCQQVYSNDTSYYVGPHCGDDHGTITIGAYSDELCTEYIGETFDIQEATGLTLDDDSLADLTSSQCISCNESTSRYKIQDGYNDDGVRDVCQALYQDSAKCDNRVATVSDDGEVSVSYQWSQKETYSQMLNPEEKACSYIEKAALNEYDKYGVIHLDGENTVIYVHDSTLIGKANRVAYDMQRAAGWQITTLIVLGVGCVGLTLLSVFLNKRMSKTPMAHNSNSQAEDSILVTRSSGTDTWA